MNGKYMEKNRQVIQFSALSMLATVARIEGSCLENATGEDFVRLLNELPDEVRVVLDNLAVGTGDESSQGEPDSDKNNYKQIVVRVNGLIPKYAKMYKRNPLLNDSSGPQLLEDFTDKSQMDAKSIAGLTNYPKLRHNLEEMAGLKDLYTEVRKLDITGGRQSKGKGRANQVNDKKMVLLGNFDTELVGNFSNCAVSLLDVYMMDNNLRKILTSGRLAGKFSALAVQEKIVERATPDSAYAAIASYYGAINTEDTFEYSSFTKMTVEQFGIMLGKFVRSSRLKAEILMNTDWCGMDRNKEITRFEAVKLASKNLGSKISDTFTDAISDCEGESLKGSLYFSDIAEGTVYDTVEVAAWLAAGIIKADELGNARLDDAVVMSKAIRMVFQILECAVKIDLDSTDYVDIDECIGK